jgi:hypothetical protein
MVQMCPFIAKASASPSGLSARLERDLREGGLQIEVVEDQLAAVARHVRIAGIGAVDLRRQRQQARRAVVDRELDEPVVVIARSGDAFEHHAAGQAGVGPGAVRPRAR